MVFLLACGRFPRLGACRAWNEFTWRRWPLLWIIPPCGAPHPLGFGCPRRRAVETWVCHARVCHWSPIRRSRGLHSLRPLYFSGSSLGGGWTAPRPRGPVLRQRGNPLQLFLRPASHHTSSHLPADPAECLRSFLSGSILGPCMPCHPTCSSLTLAATLRAGPDFQPPLESMTVRGIWSPGRGVSVAAGLHGRRWLLLPKVQYLSEQHSGPRTGLLTPQFSVAMYIVWHTCAAAL